MTRLLFLIIALLPLQAAAQTFTESTLPIIVIDTEGNTIVDEPKVLATMGIIDNGPDNINRPSDPPNDYDGVIGIEFRGSSSQALFDKKNYGIELRKVGEQDTSVSLLGMPAEEDWVLHGPYSDKSLMRNVLTFHLWSVTGRYGSRTRYVELMLNNDYKGVYVLMEKIKRDGDRVDIARLEEDENGGDDLTGGYIIKLDKFDGGNSGEGFSSTYDPPGKVREEQQIYFQYDYPRGDRITAAQENYIQSYVEAFEDALYGSNFLDPVTGYKAYADMESFVDFAIMNEVTRNVDGYRLSTFIHKDKDSKGGRLTLGPIWDFNLALGNANYCQGSNVQGFAWTFNAICPEDFWLIPFWWDRLMQDPSFVRVLNERWTELRSGPLSTASVHNYIDSVALALAEPLDRNFQRWPVLGEWIWPNEFVGDTYPDEINYLKNWVSQRMSWLDANFPLLLTITSNEPFETSGISVFPNPARDIINIQTKKPVETFEMRDIQGRLITTHEESFSEQTSLDMRNYPDGLYLMKFWFGDGETQTVIVAK